MFKRIKQFFSKQPKQHVPSFIITCTIEDNTGYKVEADWDPEFIESLRSRGYASGTDEMVVSHWMRDMYLTHSSKLAENGQEFV